MSVPPDSSELARLHAAAFGYAAEARDAEGWGRVLARSLCWVTAHEAVQGSLVGFVNVAWDGGAHAFLLDTAVWPERQGRGIGAALVARAVQEASARGALWLHVDFEPRLEGFYRRCGFAPTQAGLIRLR